MKSTSAFSTRPATASDTPFARESHHLAYRDVVERQFGPWDQALQDQFFDDTWKIGAFDILEMNGEPVGYLGVDRKVDEFTLRELVVRPAFQERGVGTNCMRDLLDAATIARVPIRLRVLRANRARPLYERLGFREFGATDIYFLMEWKPALGTVRRSGYRASQRR